MIIHTSNQTETKFAASLRDLVKGTGIEVHVIPKGVECFFVTLEELENNKCHIVIEVINANDELLDRIVGFDSCKEAYDLAKELAEYCGLDENGHQGDCWDSEDE